VVDRRRPLAELLLGEPREARRRQREIVDDDRLAAEVEQVADADDRIASAIASFSASTRSALPRANATSAHVRVLLAAALGTTWKK
jgi:hypothetical protein